MFHRGRCVEVALRGRCAAFQREFHLWRKQDLSTNKEHRFSTTRSDRIDDDNTVIFFILFPPPPPPFWFATCVTMTMRQCVCVYIHLDFYLHRFDAFIRRVLCLTRQRCIMMMSLRFQS